MATAAFEESPPVQQGTTASLPENTANSANGEIDSALLSALRDPRERLGLLKLEQTMMDFLNSPDLYWDVGGSANSLARNSQGEWIASGPFRPSTTFQRCLLHRLGDRFGIRREPQEDGFIRIFKTPASTLPDQLLLNVPEKEFQLPETTTTTTTKPRKMKIMKRSSSSNISTGSSKSKNNNNGNGKSSTQTDKERQYAEARARIFQQSQEEAMAETFDPIESTTTTTTTTSSSSSSSLVSPLTPTAPEFVPAGGTGDPTKPNKATWRNRQSELNDPDFQRRRTPPAYYGFVNNASLMGSAPPLPPSSSSSAAAVAGVTSLPLAAHPSITAPSSHLTAGPPTAYYPSSTSSSSTGYPYSTITTSTATSTTTGYFTTRPSSSTTTATTSTSASNTIPTMNFKDFPSLR